MNTFGTQPIILPEHIKIKSSETINKDCKHISGGLEENGSTR